MNCSPKAQTIDVALGEESVSAETALDGRNESPLRIEMDGVGMNTDGPGEIGGTKILHARFPQAIIPTYG